MRPSGRSPGCSSAASTSCAIVGSDAEHARRLLDDALERGTDALVVVGGDGVDLARAAGAGARRHSARASSRPAPATTMHANIGLPTNDPAAAADIVADGWTETVDLGRIRGARRHREVVRHRDGRGIRLAGHRPDQPHALAARPDALQPGDGRRAVPAAAAAVPVGVRRRRGDRHRPARLPRSATPAATAAAC